MPTKGVGERAVPGMGWIMALSPAPVRKLGLCQQSIHQAI